MTRIRRRAKSNTLFRLVKSLSFGLYTKLKAYNDVYAKGSKQWSLVEYYYHLKEWSREQELIDWPEERFATLKYHTLQWLFRALSRIGHWPGNSLFQAFGDISIAVKHHAFECADDFWEEVKPRAIQEERVGLIFEFLSLQRAIARSWESAEQAQKQLLENLELSQAAAALQAEILKIETIRVLYFDPIKTLHTQNGFVSTEDANRLKAHLANIQYGSIKSVRAKYGLLRMQVFVDLLEGLTNASDSIQQLVDLQTTNPWLREEDLGKFFMDVRSAIFVYSAKGDKKKVEAFIQLFDLYDFSDSWVFSEGISAKIEAFLWSGLFLVEPETTRKGLELIGEHVTLLMRECPKSTFIRIIQYAAIAEMHFGNYKSANRWLDELLDHKSSIKEDRISSARVMQLMCFLALNDDYTFIEGKANTVARNLRRNSQNSPTLYKIALAIGRIARCGDDRACKIVEIEKLLNELQTQEKSSNAIIAIEHFEYAAWFGKMRLELIAHQ